MEYTRLLGFELRRIHNLTKEIVRKSHPNTNKPPLTQLQAGIMGYLFHHQEKPICQKHITPINFSAISSRDFTEKHSLSRSMSLSQSITGKT